MVETARIEKRAVETTRAIIRKTVSETDEVLDAVLARQDVEIERVPVGHTVAEAPVARWEGDTFVWPILEEQLVVEKRLVLKEELRIRTKTRQEPVQQTVRLRAEHVTVEQVDDHAKRDVSNLRGEPEMSGHEYRRRMPAYDPSVHDNQIVAIYEDRARANAARDALVRGRGAA